MTPEFFMQTDRIRFSKWCENDLFYAEMLWGNPKVTEYICASGIFTMQDIENRLNQEIVNGETKGIEYWPLFEIATGKFIGCCGLRPYKENEYETGIHLLPEFWGQGYAVEAVTAVIEYAFTRLGAQKLFAGHNPNNIASRKLLNKLGFIYIGDEFYAPTGLYHPSYELENPLCFPCSGQTVMRSGRGEEAAKAHNVPMIRDLQSVQNGGRDGQKKGGGGNRAVLREGAGAGLCPLRKRTYQ